MQKIDLVSCLASSHLRTFLYCCIMKIGQRILFYEYLICFLLTIKMKNWLQIFRQRQSKNSWGQCWQYSTHNLKKMFIVIHCTLPSWLTTCTSNLLPVGKAYAPEFYYDTYNPLWQNRARVYAYSLEWTQMNPDAVDRILTYHLGIRQVRTSGAFSKDPFFSLSNITLLLSLVFHGDFQSGWPLDRDIFAMAQKRWLTHL